jgi:ankyrin repeat protein
MEAVRKEDLYIAALLLEHGARLDLTDSCGDNVIHWAARYEHSKLPLSLPY